MLDGGEERWRIRQATEGVARTQGESKGREWGAPPKGEAAEAGGWAGAAGEAAEAPNGLAGFAAAPPKGLAGLAAAAPKGLAGAAPAAGAASGARGEPQWEGGSTAGRVPSPGEVAQRRDGAPAAFGAVGFASKGLAAFRGLCGVTGRAHSSGRGGARGTPRR